MAPTCRGSKTSRRPAHAAPLPAPDRPCPWRPGRQRQFAVGPSLQGGRHRWSSASTAMRSPACALTTTPSSTRRSEADRDCRPPLPMWVVRRGRSWSLDCASYRSPRGAKNRSGCLLLVLTTAPSNRTTEPPPALVSSANHDWGHDFPLPGDRQVRRRRDGRRL